ncbi:MAG: flagellar biosynthetic protein FliO [Actinomycetota bacterium]
MDVISAGALARLIVSVVVIVALLLGVKRWADRSGGRHRGGLRVVARVPVARGAAIALVEVGRRHYVVGAGEQGVTLIDRLDDDDVEAIGLDAGTSDVDLEATSDRSDAGGAAWSGPGGVRPPARGELAYVDISNGGSVGPGIGPLERLRRMTLRAPGRVRSGGPGV